VLYQRKVILFRLVDLNCPCIVWLHPMLPGLTIFLFWGAEQIFHIGMLVLTKNIWLFHMFYSVYRLGWLIRFISHSVISGFTTASAIVIGLSQIKYFLGYNVTRSSKIIPLIESIIAGADQVGFLVSPWFYFLLIPHLILFLTVLLVFFYLFILLLILHCIGLSILNRVLEGNW